MADYRVGATSSHMGPMARNFAPADGPRAFRRIRGVARMGMGLSGDLRVNGTFVSASDRHIATVDADKVALAAIQGLNRKVEAENASMRAEITARDSRIAELDSRLRRLEEALVARAPARE